MNPNDDDEAEASYRDQLEAELIAAQKEKAKAIQGTVSMFNYQGEDNLVRWQLDLREDLDRLYHLLRGDQIKEDPDGNVAFVAPDDPNLKPFNEFGVQLILNIMSFYLNRNTILSNYDEKTIQWKVLDFGNDLADLIFNRYDEMMCTLEKEDNEKQEDFERRKQDHLSSKLKMFPMIVRELVDTVHSAYLRAYHGGERESLRTARTVTQSEPLGGPYYGQSNQSSRKFKLSSPRTWVNPS